MSPTTLPEFTGISAVLTSAWPGTGGVAGLISLPADVLPEVGSLLTDLGEDAEPGENPGAQASASSADGTPDGRSGEASAGEAIEPPRDLTAATDGDQV